MEQVYSDVNMFVNIYSQDALVYDEYAINNSISSIVGTTPGQRLFRPDFGCNVYNKLFEPMSDTVAISIKNMVMIAIERWEPRIKMVATNIVTDYASQSYYIDVQYTIPSLNNKSASYAFALSKIPG